MYDAGSQVLYLKLLSEREEKYYEREKA